MLDYCASVQDRYASADLRKSAATPFSSAEAKTAAADGSICGLQPVVNLALFKCLPEPYGASFDQSS